MPIHIIPTETAITGGEAQTTPADLRLGLNLSKFRAGIRHIVGSALIGLSSGAATIGLFWISVESGQDVAAFFAGFTAVNTYWMIAYCRAACSALTDDYHRSLSRAEAAKQQANRVLRIEGLRRRGLAGEADGDMGQGSPSASIHRIFPDRDTVQ